VLRGDLRTDEAMKIILKMPPPDKRRSNKASKNAKNTRRKKAS